MSSDKEHLCSTIVRLRGFDISVATRLISPDLPTLFFFHGSMGNRRQFEELFELGLEGANIVAYDALGCGDSDKPDKYEAYSSAALAEDAISIVSMFSSKTNVLVGHSYGTSVIARVNQALSSSVAIAGVVFIGTADHMQAGGHPIFLLPLPVLRCIEPIISAQFVKIAFSPRTSAEIRLKALSVNIKNDMRICQYFYRQYVWASDDDWRKLVCPTLIIQGADDAITPLVKAQSLHNRLLRWNPDSRHLFVAISGGGHLVMQEKSAEVLRLVASFLTEVLKDRR